MAEPTATTSVGLYSLFIALFGIAAGEYALIVFASLAGSLWAVSSLATNSKKAAGWLLLKIVFMAVVLTSAAATVIEAKLGWPVKQVMAPVAFFIGFLGNRWHSIIDRVIEKFVPSAGK